MTIKNCNSCIIGRSIAINNNILCKYKGIVSYDYSCSKYKKSSTHQNTINIYKCYDCQFFNLKEVETDKFDRIGLCQLFSVRYYDGNSKKACSKFTKKVKLEVS